MRFAELGRFLVRWLLIGAAAAGARVLLRREGTVEAIAYGFEFGLVVTIASVVGQKLRERKERKHRIAS